ncbi:MAG: type II secretion system protein J [Chthoniobacteraceae bacterium]
MLRLRATNALAASGTPVRVGTRQPGFSLIEVLVATTILTLIVAMLGGVVSTVGASLRTATGRSECGLSARAIADYIQTDLKAALLPLNTSDTANLQFILNSSAIPDKYKIGDALFWQAPVANDTTFGDIAEVGYFVKWVTDDRSKPVPILCRFFVEPADSSSTSNYKIYQDPAAWLNQTTVDAAAPGTVDQNYTGLFAENVVAIWFRCLDGQGKAYAGRTFDSRNSIADSDGNVRRLPSSVQVSFVLLDSRASARLTAASQTILVAMANTVGDEIDATANADGTLSPAERFVSKALSDSSLRSISGGLKSHTTTVSLVNAR